jgi:predicted phosphodiesterase
MQSKELPDLEAIEDNGVYRVLDLDDPDHETAKRILIYGVTANLAAGAGAVAGFVAANNVIPEHIEYAKGFGMDLSLSTKPGISVDALSNTISDSHILINSGIPGIHGLHGVITNLSPHKGEPTEFFGQMAGLISNLHDRVVEPTNYELVRHLEIGTGIGAISAAAIASIVVNRVRARKEKEKLIESRITELRDDHLNTGNLMNAKIADEMAADLKSGRLRRRRRRIVAAAAAIAIGAMGMSNKQVTNFDSSPATDNTVEISSDVTKIIPEVKGLELTGFAGQLLNTVVYGVVQIKKSSDSTWTKDAKLITKSYDKFANGPGTDLINNPEEEPIEQVSDIHCVYPNEEEYLPTVNRLFKAPIIINTGDTQTNSGTMFYEKDCYKDFIKGVQVAAAANKQHVLVIMVAGNHDDKKPINEDLGNVKVVDLTNSSPTIVADGIRFIGTQDPERTVWYPTLPANPLEQIKVIGQQGDSLAKLACKYYNSGENLPIVVIAHEHQALAQTVKDGCADLAVDGHTHNNSGVKSYIGDNGHTVLHHTAGSASGVGTVGTPYQPPQKDATESIMYFNTATRKFDAVITPVAHANETTEIDNQPIPKSSEPAEQADWVTDFLKEYNAIKSH